jgi:hypothetical protein
MDQSYYMDVFGYELYASIKREDDIAEVSKIAEKLMSEAEKIPNGKELFRDVIKGSNFFNYCLANIDCVHIPYLQSYCDCLDSWSHDLNEQYERYEQQYNSSMSMLDAILSDPSLRDMSLADVEHDCDCARESFMQCQGEIQRQTNINEVKADHVGVVLNLVHNRMRSISEFINQVH